MKKYIFYILFIATFIIIPHITDAASQCPSNATPAMIASDPACWTSSSTGGYNTYKTLTCTWTCGYPLYVCYKEGSGPYFAYSDDGNNCKRYSSMCRDNCGNANCENQGIRTGQSNGTKTTATWHNGSTSYTCHYTTVKSWSTCENGVQVATSLNQLSTTGSTCDNLREPNSRTCGICGPANNVGSGLAPTVGLCAFGTATPVPPTLNASTNRWEWKCLGSNGTVTTDDVNCSAPRNEDGKCSSTAIGDYAWNATTYRGALCMGGTPTVTPVFPAYGQTVTWGCTGIGTGTTTPINACSANRLSPQPGRCNPLVDGTTSKDTPNGRCCNPDITTSCVSIDAPFTTTPALGTDRTWTWQCKGSDVNDTTKYVNCSATCVPDVALDIKPNPFMLPNNDDDPITLHIKMIASGACANNYECELIGKMLIKNGETKDVTITLKDIINDTPLSFTCPDNRNSKKDIKDNPDPKKPPMISGYCIERSCNGQGNCQAMTKTAARSLECTSTCNSDADCSTGRMIETRP